MRWSIGNGESVLINEDLWLPKLGSFKPQRLMEVPTIVWVSDLVNLEAIKWKEELIAIQFVADDARLTLSIPLFVTNKADELVWH